LYSEQVRAALEITVCHDWLLVEQALARGHLAFIPLGAWMPVLQRMFDLRNTLGLRSPIHSLVRLLNPLNADGILQSIFLPGYQ
ncbi:glycosyl transferase family protein, partial [Pseudomonas aeruginosa]